MIKIIIADDDAIIRDGLKMILESQDDFEVVGLAKNGREAWDLCKGNDIDVALLDIRMPVMDGIESAENIMRDSSASPLMLTTFDESELIIRALKAGVSGYILKNSPAQRLISSIRAVASGGTVFQQDVLEYIRTSISSKDNRKSSVFELLSIRELEITELISQGLSNKEISARLFISDGTVRNYISTILEKTALEHRTKLAVVYLKNNG